MRIGILTHHYINNYGAFLQAYSLQETLKMLYPNDEIIIINYTKKWHYFINTFGWFRFNFKKEKISGWVKKIKNPSMFKKSRKQELNLSKKCHNSKDINKLNCDLIIVGSDEVWNYEDKKSFFKEKFGYGLKSKLVAYAPSVGKSKYNSSFKNQNIIKNIINFKNISSRDESTDDFIKHITKKDAIRVLDPTLLICFPTKNVFKESSEKYILFYYCDDISSFLMNQIKIFSEKNGYKLISAGESNKYCSNEYINVNPFEWVELFKNASYIFTGTFHGCVFSLKFHKPFSAFLTNKSRMIKVSSLLKMFYMQDRIINNNFITLNFDELFKIDYSYFKKNFNYIYDSSLNFLKTCIEDKQNE